ncbi:hypothetical protein HOE37_06405 [Candidatus Woesearchaeota archaeon]|jgi:hypothetical protein|nr:hypothetical protein [Candidatus Woesearchaeota archaeon]
MNNKLIKSLTLILGFIFLSGFFSSDPNSFFRSPSSIKKSLYKLEGQSLDTAIDRLGFPQAEQSIAGRKVYIWSDDDSSSFFSGRKVFDWYMIEKRDFKCVLKAVVNKKDIITKLEIKANSVYYCPGQRSN